MTAEEIADALKQSVHVVKKESSGWK